MSKSMQQTIVALHDEGVQTGDIADRVGCRREYVRAVLSRNNRSPSVDEWVTNRRRTGIENRQRRRAEQVAKNMIRNTSPTPRQQQILNIMQEVFGGEMEAEKRNYGKVADLLGIKHFDSVVVSLNSLRAKGLVVSIGTSMTKPERWVAR